MKAESRGPDEDRGEHMDNHGAFECPLPWELDEISRPGDRAISGPTSEKDHGGHDGDPECWNVYRKFQQWNCNRTPCAGVRMELRKGVPLFSDSAHHNW